MQRNAGNSHDSSNPAPRPGEESGGDSSSSDSEQFYFHLPYGDDKPSLWVRSIWPDLRRRMYDSNLLARIAEKLDAGISDVQEMIRLEKPHEDRRLRGVLEEMAAGCGRFLAIAKGSAPGKTRLDKERSKLCQRELDHLATVARTMKPLIAKNNLKEKLRTAQGFLQRLRELTEDPQHALPDVFIWMLTAGGKRLAYHRIPARDLLFSIVEEESGKFCGRVQTIFLKATYSVVGQLPGKKGAGPGGWAIQGKLQMYLWLGLTKHKKHYLKGLPKGYRDTPEILHADKPQVPPPFTVHYVEKQTFQLRAHMYQARSLIGSDSSGLSDPFSRVVFSDQSLTTQVIDETLSPTWDELLLFPEVIVYGSKEHIKDDPPVVVVEIFDQDKVGKSEFIGRALGRPHVKLSDEAYVRPCLEWHDVYRGVEQAGELLATFELLQFSEMEEKSDIPLLPQPKEAAWRSGGDRGPILPVPKEIRPTLSTYRIEYAPEISVELSAILCQVLFWGLRELRRVHLLTVDRPRADIECSGHVLQSSVILNYRKNPNFAVPVKFFDVVLKVCRRLWQELPDQEMYCPPLTIRVIDCRSFGRFTLVGTHNISSLLRFIFRPQTRRDRPLLPLVDEGETAITLDLAPKLSQASDRATAGDNSKKKQRRKAAVEEPEEDEEHQDWWSRYFASCEANAKERESHEDRMSNSSSGQGGTADMSEVAYSETDPLLARAPLTKYGEEISAKDIRKMRQELEKLETQHLVSDSPEKKRRTLRGTTCAVRLAQRLSPKYTRKVPLNCALIKVYRCELENVLEYGGFKDWLHSFDLYRGKRTGDELEDQNRIAGVFKGSLKVYKVPLPTDMVPQAGITDPQLGFFQGLPNNEPIHVLVRVYVVKNSRQMVTGGPLRNVAKNGRKFIELRESSATDLHPADLNGKADPYIVITLGTKKTSDKENYISKQLNPIFGKCFEFEATFPQDSLLSVQVFDWDLLGTDDLIGETRLDLENRFYSRHRALCGLPTRYELSGPNQWRDPLKPSQILSRLCREHKLEGPYIRGSKVRVGLKVFTFNFVGGAQEEIDPKLMEEQMALAVLHRWQDVPRVGCRLVPEHVECRPLYHPDKPGIEQGKIEMWVDMFPMDMPLPSVMTDISPRKPKSYELRVIIWNTDDVVLEDDAFFNGEKMSDIYVKGWLKGPEDTQCTDIHYREQGYGGVLSMMEEVVLPWHGGRSWVDLVLEEVCGSSISVVGEYFFGITVQRSLTGEGNFNWRYIYPFDYLPAEEKIVISRKESLFSWDETECKIPARLELQVWDADHFSADDFLGAITLDLNRFPRGAKSAKLCTLAMLKTDGSVPSVSIFKQRRVKGWWPFYVKKDNDEMELTGKVEAELQLLTKEEADKSPAGLGRNEPDPLDKPHRPDSSFIWFLNPLKSIRYIIWQNYKWMILKIFIFAMLALILALFVYSVPGYTVKKMLGA
ncbi:FER1L6 [Cordylochernes scorpioides]|uniref:FER1L6 n=1 Tax=Cordylochernes scorpioides TaxID=51811 RepID=A0ABY6LL63_9ARAC|nr:FER1L6 [Cordylochernes scorpioides]